MKACFCMCCLIGVVVLSSCGGKSASSGVAEKLDTVIEVKELKDGLPSEEENPNVIKSLGDEAGQALGEKSQDPIYGLEQLAETTEVEAGTEGGKQDNLVRVKELPALVRSERRSLREPNASAPKDQDKRLSRLKAKQLYQSGNHLELIRFEFTSNELPQLYYKASAYFQLAHRARKRTRQQVEYVRFSKRLYSRIAETTRDADLKGRSLLWLAILRWRFPAWNEDIEQQLAPLLYIQRRLKQTRVYNDSLLYSGFIYEAHRRYDKAYRYYRRLGGTTVGDDWVYDDKVRKFHKPEHVSRWYIEQLSQRQLKGFSASEQVEQQQKKAQQPKPAKYSKQAKQGVAGTAVPAVKLKAVREKELPTPTPLRRKVGSKNKRSPGKVVGEQTPLSESEAELLAPDVNTVDFEVYQESDTGAAARLLEDKATETSGEETPSFTFD